MLINGIFVEDEIYQERLIKQWKPILELLPISREYWLEVAEYCRKSKFESEELFPSLPISLKILSKLDLSKVMFTDFEEICRPVSIFAKVSHNEFIDIQNKIGIDLMMSLESSLIEQMSLYLKELIDKDGGIIINKYFKTSIIHDDPADCKISITGHILSFNVYRIKKLKKIRLMIRDKN